MQLRSTGGEREGGGELIMRGGGRAAREMRTHLKHIRKLMAAMLSAAELEPSSQ